MAEFEFENRGLARFGADLADETGDAAGLGVRRSESRQFARGIEWGGEKADVAVHRMDIIPPKPFVLSLSKRRFSLRAERRPSRIRTVLRQAQDKRLWWAKSRVD